MKRARSPDCLLKIDVETESDDSSDASETNPGSLAGGGGHADAPGAVAEAAAAHVDVPGAGAEAVAHVDAPGAEVPPHVCAPEMAGELEEAVVLPVFKKDGPANFAETLDWCVEGLSAMQVRLNALGYSLEETGSYLDMNRRGNSILALSTCFSGICTAEHALHIISQETKRTIGLNMEVLFWGACERDELCREIILANDGLESPCHLFGNFLDILPTVVLRRLQEKQKRALEEFRKKPKHDRSIKKAGRRFLREAVAILEDAKLDRDSLRAYCYKHDKGCLVCPPEHIDGKRTFWMLVAGLICISWSSLGNQVQWLDPQALPSLVFLWKVKCLPVHCCVMECTPRLDVDWIEEFLASHVVEAVVF